MNGRRNLDKGAQDPAEDIPAAGMAEHEESAANGPTWKQGRDPDRRKRQRVVLSNTNGLSFEGEISEDERSRIVDTLLKEATSSLQEAEAKVLETEACAKAALAEADLHTATSKKVMAEIKTERAVTVSQLAVTLATVVGIFGGLFAIYRGLKAASSAETVEDTQPKAEPKRLEGPK